MNFEFCDCYDYDLILDGTLTIEQLNEIILNDADDNN